MERSIQEFRPGVGVFRSDIAPHFITKQVHHMRPTSMFSPRQVQSIHRPKPLGPVMLEFME
jgi:hypothetical protein